MVVQVRLEVHLLYLQLTCSSRSEVLIVVRVEDVDYEVDAEVELEFLRHEVTLKHLGRNQLVPGLEELVFGSFVERGGQGVQEHACVRVRRALLPALHLFVQFLLKTGHLVSQPR